MSDRDRLVPVTAWERTAPTIGIVTVTYNSGRVIGGFLCSLMAQSYSNFLLYAVDNASADDTGELLRAVKDSRVRIMANIDNLGIAEANNQGIRQALSDGCKLVLLINNDTEFDSALLDKLVAGLNQYGCDMVAPKILFYGEGTIWSAGGGMNARRAYSGFHYGYGEVDRGQFDTPRRVDHAPACCLLIRDTVFTAIGMMDGRYFTYVEDTDFCYRAKRAGLTLMYLPSATLLHKAHSLTGGLFSHFMMRYTTRNRVYFLLKHFGPWRGLYYLPAYQLHLLLQLLSGRAGLSMFWLRERALLEGVRLWRESAVS
jgi:GT2 family glycosyltransferase